MAVSPTQLEELQVLSAIFGDEIVAGRQNGAASSSAAPSSSESTYSRVFSMRLPLNPTLPLRICSATEGLQSVDSFSTLPPVILYVALPPSYPAAAPPSFHLEAPFLSIRMLAGLAAELLSMFEKGEPVLYEWARFLLEDAWETVIVPEMEAAKGRSLEAAAMREQVGTQQGDTAAPAEAPLADGANDADDANGANNANGAADATDANNVIDVQSAADEDAADVLFLELNDGEAMRAVDPALQRCVMRIAAPFGTIQRQLLDHCDRVEYDRLRRGKHACASCLEERRGRDCVILRRCRHIACKECLGGFWGSRINDGLVSDAHLTCIELDCRAAVTPLDVALVVDNALYERYERLQLDGAIASLADACYCPRLACGKPATRDDDNDEMARCAYCVFVFCVECGRSWHGLSPCAVPDAMAGEEEEEEEGEDDGWEYWEEEEEGSSEEEPSEEDNVLNDGTKPKKKKLKITKLMRELGIRPCAGCGAVVSKDGGCSHMTCRICGVHWCWVCNEKMDTTVPFFSCRNLCAFSEVPEEQHRYDELMRWLEHAADEGLGT